MSGESSKDEEEDRIYMETVSAPTNIACIKYWGKADVKLNTPINDSVSVTLDQSDLRAVTTAATSKGFVKDRLWLNGVEVLEVGRRFEVCVEQVKALASDRTDDNGVVLVTKEELMTYKVHIASYNTFPTAAGLASSAAGYAALVFALAQLFGAVETFPGQLSSIARQGSGSACRSLYGGFVAWKTTADHSKAVPIADEHHWPDIRALILVVSDAKKDTSSTSGMMTSVDTSPLLAHRAQHIVSPRMDQIEQAWLHKDFDTFAKLTMMDSNQFHATCLDTYPPIFYLNDISRSIIHVIHAYNKWANQIRAAYTFDAGPNAVIYTLHPYDVELGALLHHLYPSSVSNPNYQSQIRNHTLDPTLLEAIQRTPTPKSVQHMYYTKSGPGPQSLDPRQAIIDPQTGLNTYQPPS